jgi:hypothetical protein
MPKPKPIQGSYECTDHEDFAAALWCILAEDFYHCGGQADQASLKSLISTIRSSLRLDFLLKIFRASQLGDETEVIGRVCSRDGNQIHIFWASDASGIVDVFPAALGETCAHLIGGYVCSNGWSLCQFSGTQIENFRPDIISRDDLFQIIEQLIADNDMSWKDVDDESTTTREFLEKNYRE